MSLSIDQKACWIAISCLKKWKKEKLNKILKSTDSITDLFEPNKLLKKYVTTGQEDEGLDVIYSNMSNYKKISKRIEENNVMVVPITSNDYPQILKKNLQPKYLPPVIFIKGNMQIFKKRSIAIVGSRNASHKALEFTDNIAKLASAGNKAVVSGFAKGVDRKALDSAIKSKGQSVIVLPQGILTYRNKNYMNNIKEGNVALLSAYHPDATWSVKLAMARNSMIYGLAEEIFVGESGESGGTWHGVMDGLRKGRKIFVRKPDYNEKNANDELIRKGAVPVDFNGKIIYDSREKEVVETLREDDNNLKQSKLF